MLVKLVDIHKIYRTNNIGFHALRGIHLEMDRGEFVAVVGPSGCGKTTLLNIIGGLDEPSSGDMVIDGKITTKFREDEWDYFRNHKIGFVFQSYNLIDNMNIIENVAIASILQGKKRFECMEKAKDILIRFGLKDHLHKTPKQLSGGQRQRVAIARALINDPDIIMADEPTGALDSKTSDGVMGLIKSISADKLVIVVTHNKKIAKKYADRVIRLEDGLITSDTKEKSEGTGKVKVELKPKLIPTKFGFFQSFRMALTNIMSRKWRTFLIALGLSIGITGLLAIDTVGSGVRREIDAEKNQALLSPEVFLSVESDATGIYNPSPIPDASETISKIKTLVSAIDEIYLRKDVSFILSGKEPTNIQEGDIYIANGFRIVPDNLDYLGKGKDLIGDGTMPSTEAEIAITQSIARHVTKEYSIPIEQLWDLVKGSTLYVADSLKPDFNYMKNHPDIQSGCTTYFDYSEVSIIRYGTEIQNKAWILANFGVNQLYDEMTYAQIACTRSVYENETFHQPAELSSGMWYAKEKVLSYKALTVVGIIKNHVGEELYFSEEGVEYFNGKTFTFTTNEFTAYLHQNEVQNKAKIFARLESNGIAVTERGSTEGEWQLLLKIITHIIQFGVSMIVFVAVVTAVIMLIMVLYISILERKREIGLLRSLGATRSDIRRIFVSETAMIGLLSGLMSVAFTIILVAVMDPVIFNHFGTEIAETFPYNDGTFLYFRGQSAINAILASVLIAVLGGYIPASKAAKKPPIDALRRT